MFSLFCCLNILITNRDILELHRCDLVSLFQILIMIMPVLIHLFVIIIQYSFYFNFLFFFIFCNKNLITKIC